MTRILVGPFNRVEGDLEVALELVGNRVERAEVSTTLYRGFEQILMGRPPLDALVIAPRICGICSVSQSLAAALALRQVMKVQPAPNGVLCARIAHAAENMADHLTHFYLFFMPDFARETYADRPWFGVVQDRFKAMSGQAAAQMLPARSRLLHIMGLLAGKWPHSLAFQPGGTTQAVDLGGRIRLLGILREFRAFLETTLFGTDLETILAVSNSGQLAGLAGGNGDFSLFLRIAQDLGLDQMGLFGGPYLSYGAYDDLFAPGVFDGTLGRLDAGVIREDPAHAWMSGESKHPFAGDTWPDAVKPGGYSWAKAPRLDGKAVEVGAVARQIVQQDALIGDLVRSGPGSNVFARVVARLMELAKVVVAAEGWVQELQLKQPFCVPSLPVAEDGMGVGMVEAARGALGHWLVVKDQKILRYQIIAPTTWNFSPRDQGGQPGPLEQALAGLEVGEQGAKSVQVQHIVRSFDPCMVCTAH